MCAVVNHVLQHTVLTTLISKKKVKESAVPKLKYNEQEIKWETKEFNIQFWTSNVLRNSEEESLSFVTNKSSPLKTILKCTFGVVILKRK